MSYKNELDKIIWSFSPLHLYEQCPDAFYNKKITKDEINEGNFYSDSGSFIHKINADIFLNEKNLDEAINDYVNNYENNIFYKTKQSIMDKKYIQGIEYFLNFDLKKMKEYDIVGVEDKILFKIDKYSFISYIDLILKSKKNQELYLIDHKSLTHFLKKDGKPLKNQLSNFKSYSNQMYLYCNAIYNKYNQFPTKIIWNHFFEQKITEIPFNKKDYENTINWAISTIEKIYADNQFDAKKDYMMCKVLCGYRNSCCYINDENE